LCGGKAGNSGAAVLILNVIVPEPGEGDVACSRDDHFSFACHPSVFKVKKNLIFGPKFKKTR